MTAIEIIDIARSLLNEPLDASRTFPDNSSNFLADSTLLTYHNLIQEEVAAEIGQTHEDFFVTQAFLNISAGVAEYTLPTGFVKMRRLEDVRAGRSVEIIPVTMNAGGGSVGWGSTTMWGNSYYIRGNQVVFSDTPTFTDNSAIRLQYIKKLADVSAGSLTSELPAEHHRVLVWGIVKLCLFGQNASDPMLTLANNEYEKNLINIKKMAENRQTQRPRHVNITYQKEVG